LLAEDNDVAEVTEKRLAAGACEAAKQVEACLSAEPLESARTEDENLQVVEAARKAEEDRLAAEVLQACGEENHLLAEDNDVAEVTEKRLAAGACEAAKQVEACLSADPLESAGTADEDRQTVEVAEHAEPARLAEEQRNAFIANEDLAAKNKLVFTCRVNGIAYDTLEASMALRTIFEEAAKSVILSTVGDARVLPEHVSLELSAGSVVVCATVDLPDGVSIDEINQRLGSMDLGAAILQQFQAKMAAMESEAITEQVVLSGTQVADPVEELPQQVATMDGEAEPPGDETAFPLSYQDFLRGSGLDVVEEEMSKKGPEQADSESENSQPPPLLPKALPVIGDVEERAEKSAPSPACLEDFSLAEKLEGTIENAPPPLPALPNDTLALQEAEEEEEAEKSAPPPACLEDFSMAEKLEGTIENAPPPLPALPNDMLASQEDEEEEEEAEKSAPPPSLPEAPPPTLPKDLDLPALQEVTESAAEKSAPPPPLPEAFLATLGPEFGESEEAKLAPLPPTPPSQVPEESLIEEKSIPVSGTIAEELLANLQKDLTTSQLNSRHTTKSLDAVSKVSEEGDVFLDLCEKLLVETSSDAIGREASQIESSQSEAPQDILIGQVEALLGSFRDADTEDFAASVSCSGVQSSAQHEVASGGSTSSPTVVTKPAPATKADAPAAAPGVLAKAVRPPKKAAEGVLRDYSQLTAEQFSNMRVQPELRRRLASSTPALPGLSQEKAELETKRALRLVYHRVTSPPPVFRQYKDRAEKTAMEADCEEDHRPHDDPVLQAKRLQRRRAAYSSLPVSNTMNYQSWSTGPCSSPRNHRRTATGRKATSHRHRSKGGSASAPHAVAAVPPSPTATAAVGEPPAVSPPAAALAVAAERLRESQAALAADPSFRAAAARQPPRTPPKLGPIRRTHGAPLRVPTCGAPGAALAAAAKRSAVAAAGASMAATPPGTAPAPRTQRPRPQQPPSGCDMLRMLQGGALPSLLCPPV